MHALFATRQRFFAPPALRGWRLPTAANLRTLGPVAAVRRFFAFPALRRAASAPAANLRRP
eukprot:5730105-Pyramimonas_sp.AAC.1